MKILGITAFILIVVVLSGCGILGGPSSVAHIKPTTTPLRWYPPVTTITPVPTVTDPAQIPVSGVTTPPTISVSIATNCRKGPSADYDILLAFFPNEIAVVIGKYTPTNYWVITTSTGYTCWLWGQNANFIGDVNSVPDYPVPPLPTPTSIPTAVSQAASNTSIPLPALTPVPTNNPAPSPAPKPTKPPKLPPQPKPKPPPKQGGSNILFHV